MQRPSHIEILLVITGVLLLMACSTGKERIRAADKSNADLIDGSELALLKSGGLSEAMAVVRNTDESKIEFLRRQAAAVLPSDPNLPTLLARMRATVELEQGVGIAAPQIGVSRRVIWVQRLDKAPEVPFEACLNPEILSMSENTETEWEGCLSVTEGFGRVVRPAEIVVRCQNMDGVWREESVSGFTARIFQHEIDHLNGVLFTDRMDRGSEIMPEEEYRAMRKKEKEAEESKNQPVPES